MLQCTCPHVRFRHMVQIHTSYVHIYSIYRHVLVLHTQFPQCHAHCAAHTLYTHTYAWCTHMLQAYAYTYIHTVSMRTLTIWVFMSILNTHTHYGHTIPYTHAPLHDTVQLHTCRCRHALLCCAHKHTSCPHTHAAHAVQLCKVFCT